MTSRLFVGNLAFGTTSETLQALFASFGEVREVAIPTDRTTGQPRGFAFITMNNSKSAEDAIAQLNGHNLDGRSIKVDAAQERPRPQGGGGRDRF
jgi:RNA recognition motif-containing protein